MSTDNKSQCSQWCAIQPQGFPVVSYPLRKVQANGFVAQAHLDGAGLVHLQLFKLPNLGG
jgi:hypothetical protein